MQGVTVDGSQFSTISREILRFDSVSMTFDIVSISFRDSRMLLAITRYSAIGSYPDAGVVIMEGSGMIS